MRVAGGADDPCVAAERDLLITRITVGDHRAGEVARHEELVGAVAMAADGEIEDIDRHGQAAIGPHPSRDTCLLFRPSLAEDLVDPLRLGIARNRRRDLRRQKQGDARLVRAQGPTGDHLVSQVEHEGADAGGRGHENVQERASRGCPTAARELILLAIRGQVKSVFAGRDLGGYARVVAVAFDQALRSQSFFDATLRCARAGVLGNHRHADLELGWHVFQGLLAVVADHFPLAVRGAMLDFIRCFGSDLITRNVSGKRLAAGLPRLAPPTLVFGDDDFRLFHRLGQSFRRVGRLRRVAEVQFQLVRVFHIPLAAIAEGTLYKLVDGKLLLLHLTVQLRDRARLLHERVILLADLLTLLDDKRLTGGKVVGKELHARSCFQV